MYLLKINIHKLEIQLAILYELPEKTGGKWDCIPSITSYFFNPKAVNTEESDVKAPLILKIP